MFEARVMRCASKKRVFQRVWRAPGTTRVEMSVAEFELQGLGQAAKKYAFAP